MYDLKNSGLSLRTMKPKDLASFASDLNHNFMTILHAGGFKGLPGESVTGPAGIGVRGSKWFFVASRSDEFLTAYGLTSTNQVTLRLLNLAMTDNQVLLASVVGLESDDSFVEGDTIVLSSGQVLQLEIQDGSIVWVDTGISFEQTIGLTEDRVIEIVEGLTTSTDESDSVLRRFQAIAKNHSDASPGVNNAINTDSVLDIAASNSGPGVPFSNNYFLAAKELSIGAAASMCLLAGGIDQYHQLVQRTQEALTNSYIPGIDDFTAGVFLQSSYKNGIIMGHQDSDTMRDFMRMYKTATSLIIASHYSPNPEDFTEIQMTNKDVDVRAEDYINLNSRALTFSGSVLRSRILSFTNSILNLGHGSDPEATINVYASKGIFFRDSTLRSATILSTDSNGKLVKTYSVTNVSESSASTIPTSQVLATAIVNLVTSRIQPLESRMSSVEQRITNNTSFITQVRSEIRQPANTSEVAARSIDTKYVSPATLPYITTAASQGEVDARTINDKYVSPATLPARASQAESDARSDVNKYLTPNVMPYIPTAASQSEVDSLSIANKYVTPITLRSYVDRYATRFDKIVETFSSSYDHQILTFRDTNDNNIDNISIHQNQNIIFQCYIRDSKNENGANHDIGSNSSEGQGIDVDGDNSRFFDVSYAHNVQSAYWHANGNNDRSQLQINYASSTKIQSLYEISVMPMYWAAHHTGFNQATLAHITRRITTIVWAVAQLTDDYCRINFHELEHATQGMGLLITGRRLKIHAD